MAIAQSVLDLAFAEAERHRDAKILMIKVKIGEMSGVVGDSLEFAFEVLKKDTPADHTVLEIETVGLILECPECGEFRSSVGELNLICRRCGKGMQIVAGREMRVEYIDLE